MNGCLLYSLLQLMNGLKKFDIGYKGDPDLQPIRSFENKMLVRMLHSVTTYISATVSVCGTPELHTVGWNEQYPVDSPWYAFHMGFEDKCNPRYCTCSKSSCWSSIFQTRSDIWGFIENSTRAIDPAPVAWFLTKIHLISSGCPRPSITLQNRDLKDQSFNLFQYGDLLEEMYYDESFIGKVSQQVLSIPWQPPSPKMGPAPPLSKQPRLRLRWLASYQTIGFFLGLYILTWLWLGTGPITFTFVILGLAFIWVCFKALWAMYLGSKSKVKNT